jgi:AcrR family transcriptional regulator
MTSTNVRSPGLPNTRLTADERRDVIVAAAMTEFGLTGFAGTSTDAIARRAGVSQPYLFQLYGTKKDLFIAAVRHGFRRTRLAFETVGRVAIAEDPSAEHVLKVMGQAYCALLADRELLLCQLQAYASCGDPEIRAAVGDEFLQLYRSVKSLSGADDADLETWFAAGMLMNTAAAIGPALVEAGDFSFSALGRLAAEQ